MGMHSGKVALRDPDAELGPWTPPDSNPTEPTVGTLFLNSICTQASWPTQMEKQS